MNYELYDELMNSWKRREGLSEETPMEEAPAVVTSSGSIERANNGQTPAGEEGEEAIGLAPGQAAQATDDFAEEYPKEPIPLFDPENYPEYGDESSIPAAEEKKQVTPITKGGIWDRSWAVGIGQFARRSFDDEYRHKWKQGLVKEWKARGFKISEEEEQRYVLFDEGVPEVIKQQIKLEEDRQDAAIEAQGGILKAMATEIKNNPENFRNELVMGILADPEFLFLPMVWGGIFAKAIKAGHGVKTAAAAGIAADTAIGAATGAAGEGAISQREIGVASGSRMKTAAAMGGGSAFVITGATAVMKATGRAAKILETKTGIEASSHQAEIHMYANKNKVSIQEATKVVMERYGEDPTAAISELNAAAKTMTKQAEDFVGPPELEGPQLPGQPARTPARPTTGPTQQAQVYQTRGGAPSMAKVEAAQRGQAMPSPVNRAEGYGLIEDVPARDTSQWTPEGREPRTDGSGLAADIERIAWKERSAVFGAASKQGNSITDELWESTAFKPNGLTKPVMTLGEFADSSIGRAANGRKLTGAALQAKYNKFNKDMIRANRDPNQRVTLNELQEIMEETSPTMRKLFMEAGRKGGTRANQIPAKFRSQAGQINPKLASYTSLGLFAALIGYGKNHDFADAVTYPLVAGLGVAFAGKVMRGIAKANPVAKHLITGKKTHSLDDLLNEFTGKNAVYERELRKIQESARMMAGYGDLTDVAKNAASKKLLAQVTAALEDKKGYKFKALPENGKQLYHFYKDLYKEMGEVGMKEGVLDSMLENYVNHAWQHITKGSESVLDDMFGTVTKGKRLDTLHKNTRVIPTYSLGKKVGLRPRTEDVSELYTMYAKSMQNAILGKQLIEKLKKAKSPYDGTKLIMKSKEAPTNYRTIIHPQFDNMKVHPDVHEPLRAMFGSREMGAILRGASALSFLLKRQAVSMSGFHAKALYFSYLMANASLKKTILHPIKTGQSIRDFNKIFSGESYALRMFKETADSDVSREIDRALMNGLALNIVDDVGGDIFYDFMDDLSGLLDSSYKRASDAMGGSLVAKTLAAPLGAVTKPAAKTVKGARHANKFVDTVMWDRLYTGMKLQTYMNKMEILTARHGTTVPVDELSRVAAEFTNDAFGGLNWLRLAQNVENKFGSKIAHAMVNPVSRAITQLLLFAPDWTTSQIRVFYKAFVNKNPIQRQLYARYQYAGLVMFGTIMEGTNLINSGKHFWENDDMSTVDLGDGRRMSLSKQYFESAKWFWKPEQQLLNKLGTVPRTALEVLMGRQWLTGPEAWSPPIESNLEHLGMKTLPIWANSGIRQQDAQAGIAGVVGVPIYGAKEAENVWGASKKTPRGTGGRGPAGRTGPSPRGPSRYRE